MSAPTLLTNGHSMPLAVQPLPETAVQKWVVCRRIPPYHFTLGFTGIRCIDQHALIHQSTFTECVCNDLGTAINEANRRAANCVASQNAGWVNDVSLDGSHYWIWNHAQLRNFDNFIAVYYVEGPVDEL